MKKKTKKKIKMLQHDVDFLKKRVALLNDGIEKHQCYCENYKPKTVTFRRFMQLPELFKMNEQGRVKE